MGIISKFIINTILIVSVIVLIIVLAYRLFGISICGYYFCIINSESMEPEYKKNSLVIVKNGKYEDIEVNDVILFKSNVLTNKLILHRVIGKVQNGYITKGDKTSHIDEGITTKNEYIGKPVFHTNTIAIFLIWLKKSYSLVMIIIFLFLILKLCLKKNEGEGV